MPASLFSWKTSSLGLWPLNTLQQKEAQSKGPQASRVHALQEDTVAAMRCQVQTSWHAQAACPDVPHVQKKKELVSSSVHVAMDMGSLTFCQGWE